MKHIYKLYCLAAISLFGACADLDKGSDFLPERPEDVAVNGFINGYDVLKTYVDRNAVPGFKLGMSVSADDFAKKGTNYGLAVINFDEVSATNINHAAVASNDGIMDFSNAIGYFGTATDGGITAFGPALCWHANQNAIYLNKLIAPEIIPIETTSGTTVIADFESDNIGDSYPMSGNGFANVVADPEGKSGNVLEIGGPSNQSHPIFDITLPEGRKLGDYKMLLMDFNGKGSSGLYGTGMKLAINDMALVSYGSPASFQCPDGSWGRGAIALDMTLLNLSPAQMELTSFKLTVGSGTGSGHYYIDNIKMTWESGGLPTGAETFDFESNALGETYEMSSGGSATVVADPVGGSNKVLNVISNQSHPKFPVVLPAGVTLGDCTKITLQFYGTGSTGRYGQGMRLGINDSSLFGFKSPAENGCEDNKWGSITMDLTTIDLDESYKKLKEFTIAVGSATGSGNYYIDDVALHWERQSIIEKTPEEKEEILSEALESYIAGMMRANEGYATAWNVINEPMSDDDNFMLRSAETEPNTTGNFYWPDYLGDNYARTVIAYARQHYTENNGTDGLKLFINETGLDKKNSRKCERLIEMISQWESDGTTLIDGIGINLNLTYSVDPVQQAESDNTLRDVLQKLAATGKLIRISELTVQMVDGNGAAISTNNLTLEQQQAISLYYENLIRMYFELIPAAQCYGITLGAAVDSSSSVGLWDSKYNRKYTYVGFADGLAGSK